MELLLVHYSKGLLFGCKLVRNLDPHYDYYHRRSTRVEWNRHLLSLKYLPLLLAWRAWQLSSNPLQMSHKFKKTFTQFISTILRKFSVSYPLWHLPTEHDPIIKFIRIWSKFRGCRRETNVEKIFVRLKKIRNQELANLSIKNGSFYYWEWNYVFTSAGHAN